MVEPGDNPVPPATAAVPEELCLQRASRQLRLRYAEEGAYALPAEYLRVYSPSAEVTGHGPGQQVWVPGKQMVGIRSIEPMGHYAVRLCFDDGHASGLFTWPYLYHLCQHQPRLWQRYLDALVAGGLSRHPESEA